MTMSSAAWTFIGLLLFLCAVAGIIIADGFKPLLVDHYEEQQPAVDTNRIECVWWGEQNLCLCVGVIPDKPSFAFTVPPDVCGQEQETRPLGYL